MENAKKKIKQLTVSCVISDYLVCSCFLRSLFVAIIMSLTVHLTCFLTGLDYESCPTAAECENNAVDAFWRMASMTVNSALTHTVYISEHIPGGLGKHCWVKTDLSLILY